MNNDIIFAFSVFQLVFLLLDLYILTKSGRDIATKWEFTWFSALTVTHMAYLVMNTTWTLTEYDVIYLDRRLLMFVCTVSLWAVTNCATSFFLFAVERMQLNRFRYGAGRWIRQIPAFIATVMIGANPWTGLVFTLDKDGYFIHESFYLPVLLCVTLYLLAVALIAAVNLVRIRTTSSRRLNGAMLGSVCIIILFILADGTLTKASILPSAVFAVIMIIFMIMQESNINSDALTGMNNRRKAEEYLSERLAGVSPADPLYLYIGDLNSFKKINDTYGHIEGDQALILCSRALKRTIGGLNGFAARFGGDEFLLSWNPARVGKEDPEILIELADKYLEEQSKDKPYELKMSIGYVRCTDPKKSLNAYIKEADEMLYEKKAIVHAER